MFGWLARRPALGDDAALQLLETFERMSREALARVLRPEDSQCPWELLEDAVGPASGSDPCVMLVVMVLGGQSEHWVHAALCWWCSVFKVFFFLFSGSVLLFTVNFVLPVCIQMPLHPG